MNPVWQALIDAETKKTRIKGAPRAKPRQLEHKEQSIVCEWLTKRGHEFFSVPNAAKRGPKLINFLRKEGYRKGAPDLVLITAPPKRPGYHVVIEMKQANASMADVELEQLDTHKVMRSESWIPIIGFGAGQTIAELEQLGY